VYFRRSRVLGEIERAAETAAPVFAASIAAFTANAPAWNLETDDLEAPPT
jgi:hypothetical protein